MADLEAAEQQCSEVQAQLDAVKAEFRRYQAVEVRLLEQRVLRQLQGSSGSSSSSGSGPGARAGASAAAGESSSCEAAGSGAAGVPAVTVADLEAACCHEGIAAALREARLERLQRQRVQQELVAAQHAGEQAAAAKSRHGAEARAARERAERLAAELADCQSKVGQPGPVGLHVFMPARNLHHVSRHHCF